MRISSKRVKRKLILLFSFLCAGAIIVGEKLSQQEHQAETILKRRLIKTLPIPFLKGKPGITISAPRPVSVFETLALSPDGKNLALWLEPLRYGGKFSLLDINEEKLNKDFDFDEFSLELLFPAYFLAAAKPSYISWAPDGSKVAISVRKVLLTATEEKRRAFKKWLTIIYDIFKGTIKTIKGYTIVNIVNPWEASTEGILVKKEEGEEKFSLALLSLPSEKVLWSLTPKNFPLRIDEVIAKDKGKIYVFEQGKVGEFKIWAIEPPSREEKILLHLNLGNKLRCYSLPSQDLKYFLIIRVPPKYPLEWGPFGGESVLEIRRFPTGELVKGLRNKNFWVEFIRWSADGKKIAFFKYNTQEGWLIIWDFGKDKLYKVPWKGECIESIDFNPESSSLYLLSRENVKECNIYGIDLPNE